MRVVRLRISHPAIGEMSVPVGAQGLIVGRAGGHADLDMNWDRLVSRRHVRFWVERNTVWFEDQKSRNGTWEGGVQRVGRHPLREGVWLLVGESYFTAAPPEVVSAGPTNSGLETLDVPSMATPARATVRIEPPQGQKPHPAASDLSMNSLGVALPTSGAPDSFDTSFGEHTSAHFAALTAAPEKHDEETPSTAPEKHGGFGNATEEFAALLPPSPESSSSSPSSSGKLDASARRPVPEVPPARPIPSFTGEKRVVLKMRDRNELRTFWQENVQKGGLYVNSERPLPRGTVVEVAVTTPNGELVLSAQVVHVLDPATAQRLGQAAGVGLQFAAISPEQRDAVHRYIDGMTSVLVSPPRAGAPDSKPSGAALDQVMAKLRQFLSMMEREDVYGALQVDPRATQPEILQRIGELKKAFSAVEGAVSPPQVARIDAAKRQLETISSIMGTVSRRLEHDFRHGHVRAEERIEEARQKRGPSLIQLRAIWHAALPNNLPMVTVVVRRALEAKKRRNIAEAVALGRQALELDPFQEDLRKTVEAWAAASPTH